MIFLMAISNVIRISEILLGQQKCATSFFRLVAILLKNGLNFRLGELTAAFIQLAIDFC